MMCIHYRRKRATGEREGRERKEREERHRRETGERDGPEKKERERREKQVGCY